MVRESETGVKATLRTSTPASAPLLGRVVIAAAIVVAFSWSTSVGAQEPDHPTLYLESGTGHVGGEVATSLLLRMPEIGNADAVELLLTFNETVLAFDRLETSTAFETGSGRPGQAGEVILLVSSEDGCQSGATCHVGTLYWQALAEADAAIQLESVTVLDGPQAIPGVKAVDALVSIGTSPNTQPSANQLQPADDATLGLGNAAVLGGLVLLLGAAVAAPLAVIGLRRRRATVRPTTAVLDHNEVYRLATRYLDDLQAAGSVDESHPDVEALARAHSTEV